MTWLIGSRLGRYALMVAVGASALLLTIVYLNDRAKRLAAMKALQAALRAAQVRKEKADEVRDMDRSERDDALARWMRDND
mgnify:FL=1